MKLSMRKKKRTVQVPVVTATEAQVARAKARLNDVAGRVPGFHQEFPWFQEVVDALPDLKPLCRVMQELRPFFLDALVDAGVSVPREVWEHFGLGWCYRDFVQSAAQGDAPGAASANRRART